MSIIDAAFAADLARGLTEEQAQANAEIMVWAAIEKDSPQKRWANADFENRAPIYRALRIDPAETYASYAIAPFRLSKNDDGAWRILAAWPCPALLDNTDPFIWLDIDEVIEWEPKADTATVLADPAPQLVGALSDEANTIHASPRAFFQGWAIRRAQYAMLRATTSAHWSTPPKERDEVPGALLIGDLDRVRLSIADLPAHIETQGIDPKALNRAIMRAARLPRVVAAQQILRAA